MSTGVYTEQRRQALTLANETYRGRALLKRRIKAGEITAAEVILDPPSIAFGWMVVDVIGAQRQWSVAKAQRLLASDRISEHKTIGALTSRQRLLLVRQLSK